MSCDRRFVVKAQPPAITKVCAKSPPSPACIRATERVGPSGRDGATGPAGPGRSAIVAENKDSATISAGMAVAMSSAGAGVVRASRDEVNRQAVGVAETTAAPGANLTVVLLGICEVADWSAAAGAAWLPANAKLWLALGGQSTTAPEATSGQFHQTLGSVISPQKIVVAPSRVLILT